MGSCCNESKHHYDISMSKRTRRPSKVQDADQNSATASDTDAPVKGDESCPSTVLVGEAEESDRKKSLKQLIKSRSSLGQHFTEEEKQLQLVTKQQQEGVQGLKLKRMVIRYAKVLSHLIKAKGDSRKKPVLLLKM
ncbi:uncharacterized protein LOC132167941 [Corylus avellana]|uniref:uncharacterized protein LOC132167941 n=1 Tax=Corylus avellana TaxID=13451 RepID=UPI00286AF880|nr:uncharacterized protein LOC132167941 [Corylus avellana]